jgi:hypothetical protein
LRTRKRSSCCSHGLREVVVREDLETVQPVVEGRFRREEDDRNAARERVRLESATDFEAVEPRHHHVEEDEVRRVAANLLQSLDAVFGGANFVLRVLRVRSCLSRMKRSRGSSSMTRMRATVKRCRFGHESFLVVRSR